MMMFSPLVVFVKLDINKLEDPFLFLDPVFEAPDSVLSISVVFFSVFRGLRLPGSFHPNTCFHQALFNSIKFHVSPKRNYRSQ